MGDHQLLGDLFHASEKLAAEVSVEPFDTPSATHSGGLRSLRQAPGSAWD
jgi:hypothetical protein